MYPECENCKWCVNNGGCDAHFQSQAPDDCPDKFRLLED